VVVRVYIAASYIVPQQNIVPTFRRNTVPPSSGQHATSKPQCHDAKITIWTI